MGQFITGELAALVGIENLRCAITFNRFCQNVHAESGIQGVRQAPAQNFATIPIHHRDQIEKTFSHGEVTYVGRPDLVVAINR